MLTKRQAMLKALEDAGSRGCTRRELARVGGTKWKDHIAALEDDFFFRKHRSRIRAGETWRWVLLAPMLTHGETCEVPAQGRLLDPEELPGRPAEPHYLAAVAA